MSVIHLEVPKRLRPLVALAHSVAAGYLRPISRKYDRAEHAYPKELDLLAAAFGGLNEAGGLGGAGVRGESKRPPETARERRPGSAQLATVLGLAELCWGDVGLVLSLPGQGLGNAAIAAVGTAAQKARFADRWAAMAITEPEAGSDAAAIRTTARKDGDGWVLDGEKIYVTCGERADLVVVWATLDPGRGRAAIKSFVVEKGTPGMEVVRLDRKMGIRASDTAVIRFDGCRIPADHLLGDEAIAEQAGFSGVKQTFDNTRPMVAAMAVGVARAALERATELLADAEVRPDWGGPLHAGPAAAERLVDMEAELEASRLLMMKAAWMADARRPNSMEASMAKAKAARVANAITLGAVELCGAAGVEERELLEKWARDSKILDIFEGTQQIQMLIVARRLLGKRSSELR
ncbi:MAG TPA: acyl-CoA dehydrogenase family protein [Sandaracinaceae bacterium LLY-WYZ-13_1]|nr:acyl-CoA dehydrogenase family protein [Sandaracinaceae bacterium LLY-WYZ-13_1]